jgi:hypothetical protein
VTVGGCEIAWSTAEVAGASPDTVTFRLSGDRDTIALRHDVEIAAGAADVEQRDGMTLVRSRRTSPSDEHLTLRRS